MSVAPTRASGLWSTGLAGNARRVADSLRTLGPCTRAELITATGLSRPTVTATIAELAAAGLAVEGTSTGRLTGGRPASVVRLTRTAGLAVGVDVGRRHIRVAIADLGHEILAEQAVRLVEDADDNPGPVLDLGAELVGRVLSEVDADRTDVIGVGLGIPAPITLTGRIGSPMLLPGWEHLLPAEEFAGRLGVPVLLSNDANLGALGEYQWGAGRGCPVLVYVKLATGIGAGIVLDGRLFVGSAGTAGELGHVTIDARGPVCRCGNRGCVELSAGGRALVEQARLTYPELADVSDLIRLANNGDPACRRLLSDAGALIGIALSGLVNLINPDRVLLGGELGGATDLMLEPLRRGLTESAMPAAMAAVQVGAGELAERACALGGVALVLRGAAAR
ncbi:MAG TPA: ROK family transcriptional regulator [Micromonosporaceae bacterium]|nr:ROK family transcriptional regulator [Micromonosporaceae bacterium]